MPMTLEEAIKTALKYEKRIRDLYQEAADSADDPAGKQVFSLLAGEEQNHVDYLETRLARWEETGHLQLDSLEQALPSADAIRENMGMLQTRMDREDRKDEKQMLSKALNVEVETSDFYKRMVDELSDEGRELFARFLQIENEHIQIVQAELDYLSHTGYWFNIKEFDME
jgi:rubrerythrin